MQSTGIFQTKQFFFYFENILAVSVLGKMET